MEGKMSEFKKVSHCWWFDSHNSAKRSPWLQSTLSELEKKTKGLLNLIEGDADSFAQRAEIYYSKRPELVNLIEDFYRSYRFLAEQHELLRSEVGSRRTTLFKCDSLIQSTSPHKTWDSTDNSDYPESEISEVDNLEQENDAQIESLFSAANEEMKGNGMYLEVKSSVEDNLQEHQVETKLQKQEVMQLTNDNIEPCTPNTESLPRSSLETILRFELEDTKVEAHGTKNTILESKLTSEVDGLKMDNWALTAELERKDEDKRHVIRELSMAVDILKEENSTLKNFIKKSKRSDSSEFTKWKVVFSRTARLFGLTSPRQPSLVAL